MKVASIDEVVACLKCGRLTHPDLPPHTCPAPPAASQEPTNPSPISSCTIDCALCGKPSIHECCDGGFVQHVGTRPALPSEVRDLLDWTRYECRCTATFVCSPCKSRGELAQKFAAQTEEIMLLRSERIREANLHALKALEAARAVSPSTAWLDSEISRLRAELKIKP